jgi:hypothetical protein
VRRLALALVLVLAACSKGDNVSAVRLDGTPRLPNDEGIATTITRTRIVLDGTRSYGIDKRFVSFSTYTGELVPMVSRQGQYVQLGLAKKKATWLAGIAAVIPAATPTVFYIGTLRRVDAKTHRIEFKDGTVLRLAAGVTAPKGAARLRARIDAGRHQVVELLPS